MGHMHGGNKLNCEIGSQVGTPEKLPCIIPEIFNETVSLNE